MSLTLYGNDDKGNNYTSIVSQRGLLIAATGLTLISPQIAEFTGFPIGTIFVFLTFCFVWVQEIVYIQIKYKAENVEFTRRFTSKFSDFPGLMAKYLHIGISISVVILLIVKIGFIPDAPGLIILLLIHLTLIRIFDPLLGCLCSDDSGTLTSMVAYLVIFIFAITSALEPSRLEAYNLPLPLTQGIILSLVVYTGLNIRMSYYQKFCFGYQNSLENQLRLILVPLLLLSIHQFFTLLDYLDISSAF